MKTADIQVGEQYAVMPYYSTSHDERFLGTRCRRGTVLEVRKGGKVMVDFGGSQIIEHSTREIYRLWADHAPDVEHYRNYEKALAEERQATAVRYNEAVAELGRLVPAEALPYWASGKREITVHADNSGIFGGKGEMNVVQLLAVVQAALAKEI